MKNSIIKLKGRGYLIGNLPLLILLFLSLWAFSVCLNFLPEVMSQLLDESHPEIQIFIVSGVSVVIILILTNVLSLSYMGLQRFFIRKAEHKGGKVSDLFYYLRPSKSLGAMVFVFKYTMMKFMINAVCFMPFSVSLLFLIKIIKTSASLNVTVVIFLSCVLLFINGTVFSYSVNSSLFLVKYYYIKGSCFTFRQLVSTSQKEMREHKKMLLKFDLSFVWWFLSCLLIIPSIYVFLYYGQSKAVFASEIMN